MLRKTIKIMSSEIKVIDKAFKIIGCFNEKNKSASLKKIAIITKLNKSTIIRICRSLMKHEFLIKNEIDGSYQLGFNSWKIGSTYNSTFNVANEMKSVLNEICNETRMSASYWVKAGQKKVCLYRVNSTSEVNHYIPEGSTAPLVSASGKVLLAFSNDKKKINSELQKKNYIFTSDERLKNIASVAIPIFNFNNIFCGALNVSGWKQDFTKKNINFYAKVLNYKKDQLKKILN